MLLYNIIFYGPGMWLRIETQRTSVNLKPFYPTWAATDGLHSQVC